MNLFNYGCYLVKSRFFLAFALFVIIFNGCSSDKKIAEPEVTELLNKIEAAAKNKDADSIVANMSEKVQVKAVVTAAGQTQNLSFNRDQYRDFAKKTFAVGSNYEYHRQNTQVKISADGKSATVTDETTESVTVNGQVYRSEGTEVAALVRENGKLVILYLEANGRQL